MVRGREKPIDEETAAVALTQWALFANRGAEFVRMKRRFLPFFSFFFFRYEVYVATALHIRANTIWAQKFMR